MRYWLQFGRTSCQVRLIALDDAATTAKSGTVTIELYSRAIVLVENAQMNLVRPHLIEAELL